MGCDRLSVQVHWNPETAPGKGSEKDARGGRAEERGVSVFSNC